jgi:hypothetical protein
LVDGERLPSDRFRTACRELHQRVTTDPRDWDLLAFPVLSVVLDWLADRARQRLRLPDDTAARRALHLALYLVATNQTDPRFAETDTAPLAGLVYDWMKRHRDRYGGVDVNIWKFRGNPAAFDETLGFFRNLVTQSALPRVDPGHEVVVNATSGTPALIFGLLVGLEPALPDTTQIIVVPPGSARPLPFALLPELRRLQLLRDAHTALLRWEPALAATFLAQAQAPRPLITFTSALAQRLSFDFSTALSSVEEVIAQATGRLRQLAIQVQADLLELARAAARAATAREPEPGIYPSLLREVWQSARIAWEQERYADFLARLFRLEEGTLRWAVERFLGRPAGDQLVVEGEPAIDVARRKVAHFGAAVGPAVMVGLVVGIGAAGRETAHEARAVLVDLVAIGVVIAVPAVPDALVAGEDRHAALEVHRALRTSDGGICARGRLRSAGALP